VRGAALVTDIGPRHIVICMLILDALIGSCASHLPLFGKSVVAACKTLLTTRPASSGCAVQTLRLYLEAQDDMTQFDGDFFVQHFARMSLPTSSEELRQQGLTGLAAFIRATENFDAFVSRFVATAVDTPEETAHNCLWSVLSSSAEPSEGVRAVLGALGSRLNAVTLRWCLEIMCKYYAKKHEVVARSALFALLATGHMREFLIYLAQVASAYPGANVLGLIGVFASERRNAGPVLDAVTALLQMPGSAECIVGLLGQSEAAEKMEAIAMILRHGGEGHAALARRIAASLARESVFSSSLVTEVVDRALRLPGADGAELVRAVATALKVPSDRAAVLKRLDEGAGKEEARVEPEVELLFPEDAPIEASKTERVTLEVLEAAFQTGQSPMPKKRGNLPVFSENYEDLRARLEKDVKEREAAETRAIESLAF
jgi:hypothetical protein